jgi:predicted DCC family thiol-disulfide oxidoreductase YuxK
MLVSVATVAALLYDGHCNLCTNGARRLARWARPGSLELVDFQQSGALERFPGLTYEQCMQAMQLVEPNGRIRHGADAVVASLLTRGWPFAWARLYYVPGLRFMADSAYAWVARNRYRFMGHTECQSGTCRLPAKVDPNAKKIRSA